MIRCDTGNGLKFADSIFDAITNTDVKSIDVENYSYAFQPHIRITFNGADDDEPDVFILDYDFCPYPDFKLDPIIYKFLYYSNLRTSNVSKLKRTIYEYCFDIYNRYYTANVLHDPLACIKKFFKLSKLFIKYHTHGL